MTDTEKILRRLQAEGIVAYANEHGTIAGSGPSEAWGRVFDSFISEVERRVEGVPPADIPARRANTRAGYRIGFKHGVRAALEVVRRLREGL